MSGMMPAGGKSSFGGTAFYTVQSSGQSRPQFDEDTKHTITEIPFSDLSVLQIGGARPTTFSLEIILAAAVVGAFKAKIRTTATLALQGGQSRSATLLTIANIRDYSLHGYVQCVATWFG